jgi:hypothetical protein
MPATIEDPKVLDEIGLALISSVYSYQNRLHPYHKRDNEMSNGPGTCRQLWRERAHTTNTPRFKLPGVPWRSRCWRKRLWR